MAKGNLEKYKFNILAIVLITIFSICVVPLTFQNDTFYTIKVGETIVNDGITGKDTFSWHDDLPYKSPHWLYDVGIYIIYKTAGFVGIYISTVILSIILGLSIYKVNKGCTKNNVMSLMITLLCMALLNKFITARAQLVTYILFIITIYFIEKFLESNKKRYAIGLILISILVANIHVALWPFFFILFLPYIAENIVYGIVEFYINRILPRRLKKKNMTKELINQEKEFRYESLRSARKIQICKNKNIKSLILIIIICAFTGFLTPMGDMPYTYLYNTMIGNSVNHIKEHLPTVLIQEKIFLILVTVYFIIIAFTKAKIKMRDLLLLGGLFLLGLMGQRHIALFIIINSVVLNRLLCSIIEEDKIVKIEKRITDFYGIVLAICASLVVNCGILKDNFKDPMIDEIRYPVKASNFLLDNIDFKQAKIYNGYNFGSYLLYKNIPVFIDSRADLYTIEFNGREDIFTDYINISTIEVNYKERFKEYGITHVIIYKTEKLSNVLQNDTDYNLIYEDDSFVIYEHI